MNLKAASDDPHYVLAVIALEFADPKHTYVGLTAAPAIDAKNTAFAAALEPDMHKVLDATTGIFGAKSLDDLAAPTGPRTVKDRPDDRHQRPAPRPAGGGRLL